LRRSSTCSGVISKGVGAPDAVEDSLSAEDEVTAARVGAADAQSERVFPDQQRPRAEIRKQRPITSPALVSLAICTHWALSTVGLVSGHRHSEEVAVIMMITMSIGSGSRARVDQSRVRKSTLAIFLVKELSV